MLQKLLHRSRASFRRSKSKEKNPGDKTVYTRSKSSDAATESKSLKSSLDQSASTDMCGNNQAVNGSHIAPIATLEVSPTLQYNEACNKKVTFKGLLESPETTLDAMEDEALFDDDVMEAFEVGHMSIADFLNSPHSPSDDQEIKKQRSMSDSSVKIDNNISPLQSKKMSLLDRAHSMASKDTAQKYSVPVLRRQVAEENDVDDESVLLNDRVKDNKSKMNDDKPRFSKSLENLAQEVFGNDFQSYLEHASKSPVKISLSNKTVGESIYESKEAVPPNLTLVTPLGQLQSLERPKSLSPRYNSKQCSPKPPRTCPRTEPIIRKQNLSDLGRTLSSPRRSSSRLPKLIKDCKISLSVEVNSKSKEKLDKNLESWNNEIDLRSVTSTESESQKMLSIVEDKVLHSSLDVDSEKAPKPIIRRTNSTGSANPATLCIDHTIIDALSSHPKISKSDSQYVNIGSFSDRAFSVSESSLCDIQFPPPPPPDVDYPSYSDYEWDIVSEIASGSPIEDSDIRRQIDPLIETLLTIVPLPTEHELLVPALTKAFSEIVSEIVTSRRKLKRVMKAIEIHQQILKEQSKQIQLQSKEISQLKQMKFIGKTPQIIERRHSEGVKRRSHATRSTNNHRQSREMVELNHTLDSIIHQCSSLQTTPRDENEESSKKGTNINDQTQGTSLRRVNTLPARTIKLKSLDY